MKLNIPAIRNLMDNRCGGNYNAFSRETGINVAFLYRILNEKCSAGLKTYNRLIDYLEKNDLIVSDYIFLP